jgi:hypothetical protein
MAKGPLKQTSLHAFFSSKVALPNDDDDVVVSSTIKKGAIVISDSEEEEAPLENSNKRARANRLVIPDTDDEDDNEPAVTRVRKAPSPSTEDTFTASHVRRGGDSSIKTIFRTTTGEVHQVLYRLQSRQPADESTITTMLERATTLAR